MFVEGIYECGAAEVGRRVPTVSLQFHRRPAKTRTDRSGDTIKYLEYIQRSRHHTLRVIGSTNPSSAAINSEDGTAVLLQAVNSVHNTTYDAVGAHNHNGGRVQRHKVS